MNFPSIFTSSFDQIYSMLKVFFFTIKFLLHKKDIMKYENLDINTQIRNAEYASAAHEIKKN